MTTPPRAGLIARKVRARCVPMARAAVARGGNGDLRHDRIAGGFHRTGKRGRAAGRQPAAPRGRPHGARPGCAARGGVHRAGGAQRRDAAGARRGRGPRHHLPALAGDLGRGHGSARRGDRRPHPGKDLARNEHHRPGRGAPTRRARRSSRAPRRMDCPVSGGCHRAATGNISIFAGGPRATFERVLPVLAILGQRILHTGPVGSAPRRSRC